MPPFIFAASRGSSSIAAYKSLRSLVEERKNESDETEREREREMCSHVSESSPSGRHRRWERNVVKRDGGVKGQEGGGKRRIVF